ncbi:DMT family transporter [cf. Phormidesmis sp. LEGE 11477]|uniref:DMT family transporter n=1 Tax=cf. Phormidesmis sp. LEGE 11477 TaxID=1828680 RepID=UPI00187E1CEA|nr:DMT family transporter [cf. Phormidesmis sp. LEGE 11477]MBE9061222.1 DMT family transporter [cf. Phormidesmis sp. LEGE 11477]
MRISDVLELLLLSALWGGSFLFMRIAAPALGPVWLIECRVLLAGLALLPLLLRSQAWSVIRPSLVPLFIVGSINSALPFLFLAFASLSLPAGYTSIVNATTPLFGTLIAATWFQEKLTIARTLGLLLGFAGVVVLIGLQPMTITPMVIGSIAAGLMAAIMYAISAPYAKRHLSGIPPLLIAPASQLSAAVALLPLLPFTAPAAVPSARIMLAVLALALFSTSLAYLLYFRLIQNVGSSKALTVAYLVPIFAVLWGTVFLHETLTVAIVLGCCLILLGTAIANGLLMLPSQRS